MWGIHPKGGMEFQPGRRRATIYKAWRAAVVVAGLPDGTVTDPSGFLAATGSQPFDIAFGSTDFLIVWSNYRPSDGNDVRGALVTTSGTTPTPNGFPIASGEAWQSQPRVAWNGDRYLAVWNDATDVSDEDAYDIRGARLDGSGTVLDPDGIPIATGPGTKSWPDVVANGSFLVTWTDNRRRLATEDLFATRVDPDGTVARPDGFELAPSVSLSGSSVAPALRDGTFSVAYGRYVPEQPYGTTRTFIRTVNPK